MPISTTVPQTVEQRRETLRTADPRLRAATIRIGVFEANMTREQMADKLAEAGVFFRDGRYLHADGDELKLLFPDITDK
ncbi:hypothetical protein [Halorubrum ezzemoulense]|nr:hypothetical protein [Halorubrum ezzemoulense]MDB9285433.1 hypothetical protein [Halorubrum ezzemoulense]